jgi:hypothetical protein
MHLPWRTLTAAWLPKRNMVAYRNQMTRKSFLGQEVRLLPCMCFSGRRRNQSSHSCSCDWPYGDTFVFVKTCQSVPPPRFGSPSVLALRNAVRHSKLRSRNVNQCDYHISGKEGCRMMAFICPRSSRNIEKGIPLRRFPDVVILRFDSHWCKEVVIDAK